MEPKAIWEVGPGVPEFDSWNLMSESPSSLWEGPLKRMTSPPEGQGETGAGHPEHRAHEAGRLAVQQEEAGTQQGAKGPQGNGCRAVVQHQERQNLLPSAAVP